MMLPSMRLDGQVALVTGGGSGLGEAAALALASAGAVVALIGRRLEPLEQVAAVIRASGGQASVHLADVTQPETLAPAVAAIGRIDILVNSAGVNSPKPSLDLTAPEWDRVMDTNVRGTFLASQAVLPGMVARGGGCIVNLGSIAGDRGIANRAVYGTSKAAVAHLTRALAVEMGVHKIRVNAIAPTVIVTELNRALVQQQPELYRAIVDRTPLGRLGERDDITGAIVFLASPAAAFITGQILYIDGGYSAG
jgi:NAD(P)-dependent dehydrogenase (short-subunit alcohol dehydrogenase family)